MSEFWRLIIVSQVSFNLVKTIIKWQVFIFITVTFIFNIRFTPKLISSFRHITIFLFFLLKKYPDISNYIILLLLFFLLFLFPYQKVSKYFSWYYTFFFPPFIVFLSLSKSLQISMIVLSFFVSSFSFSFFRIKKSPNTSNYFIF